MQRKMIWNAKMERALWVEFLKAQPLSTIPRLLMRRANVRSIACMYIYIHSTILCLRTVLHGLVTLYTYWLRPKQTEAEAAGS